MSLNICFMHEAFCTDETGQRMRENQRLRVTLITGRTIEQGVGKEQGKTSQEYLESVAVCFVDPQDLKQLGIKEKTNILVSTKYGSVVVRALKSLRTLHRGEIGRAHV